jgi:hypothetical protein
MKTPLTHWNTPVSVRKKSSPAVQAGGSVVPIRSGVVFAALLKSTAPDGDTSCRMTGFCATRGKARIKILNKFLI